MITVVWSNQLGSNASGLIDAITCSNFIIVGGFTITIDTSTSGNIGTTPMTCKRLESNTSCNNNGVFFLSNSPALTLTAVSLSSNISFLLDPQGNETYKMHPTLEHWYFQTSPINN